jgi:uncharacterized protein
VFVGGLFPYLVLVLLPTLAITGWAAWRVRSTYSRWSQVNSGISMSSFDFARYLLDRQGMANVSIEAIPGNLTDHYDPRSKTLRVSSAVAGRPQMGRYDPYDQAIGVPSAPHYLSVAAAAVIAHEVGHALQDRDRDRAMALRQTIVPVAQIGSSVAPWLIIAGIFMHITGLAVVGLVFFAGAVAFTFVTLPVEFGASKRALAFVEPLGLIGERGDGARQVLRAAGWTYVAAALTALLTFFYYLLLLFGGNSRR